MFDSDAFHRTLFFPRRTTTPTPVGARDVGVDVPATTSAAHATLQLRCHRPLGTRCTVLLFHGNGEVVADYDSAAAEFARAGAALAVVDYRGYGESTGEPTLRTVIGDAPLVVRALRAELGRREKLLVMGRSLGSACAIEIYGLGDDDDVAGVILESGFTDLGALIDRRRMPRPSAVTAADRAVFDPIPKLTRGSLPLLVIHGSHDTLIAPAEASAAYAAAGGADKELVLLDGYGHNDVAAAPEYWLALAAFVDRVCR